MNRDFEHDIAKSMKTIDWLKSELLATLSSIYRSMARGDEDPKAGDIANLIIEAYLLGKRLGISYDQIDEQIERNLLENIQNEHQIEKWYKDFTSLVNHRKGRSN